MGKDAAMPKPVPLPVRRKLFERFQKGEAPAALAAAFGLPPRTVRGLCEAFRRRGDAAVGCRYAAPIPALSGAPKDWRDTACQLRRDHPTWGAGLLRVILQRDVPEHAWPSPRALQRWLKAAGLAPAPAGRRPRINAARATIPHEVWQMDAAEAIGLADGSAICWLRLVDEFSGAVLRTTVFPPAAVARGRGRRGAGRSAPGVRAVGPAASVACGQRPALGIG